jgi:hypothetical protein
MKNADYALEYLARSSVPFWAKRLNVFHQLLEHRPSNERAKLITELSSLLWDETKPIGEEAVPESQWEAILTGPCNGDKQLITEVSANERWLRAKGSNLIQFAVPFDPRYYERIITPFMTVKEFPLHLLWAGEPDGWHPEDRWDELLSEWVPPYEGAKERMKKLARSLREDRRTRLFRFKLPVAGVFGA